MGPGHPRETGPHRVWWAHRPRLGFPWRRFYARIRAAGSSTEITSTISTTLLRRREGSPTPPASAERCCSHAWTTAWLGLARWSRTKRSDQVDGAVWWAWSWPYRECTLELASRSRGRSLPTPRSEERRVGKEWSCQERWSEYQL